MKIFKIDQSSKYFKYHFNGDSLLKIEKHGNMTEPIYLNIRDNFVANWFISNKGLWDEIPILHQTHYESIWMASHGEFNTHKCTFHIVKSNVKSTSDEYLGFTRQCH